MATATTTVELLYQRCFGRVSQAIDHSNPGYSNQDDQTSRLIWRELRGSLQSWHDRYQDHRAAVSLRQHGARDTQIMGNRVMVSLSDDLRLISRQVDGFHETQAALRLPRESELRVQAAAATVNQDQNAKAPPTKDLDASNVLSDPGSTSDVFVDASSNTSEVEASASTSVTPHVPCEEVTASSHSMSTKANTTTEASSRLAADGQNDKQTLSARRPIDICIICKKMLQDTCE